MRRDDQDWAAIMRSQAEANQLEDQEKKRVAELRKKQYKEELDRQVMMKQQLRSASSDRLRPEESKYSQPSPSSQYNYQIPSPNLPPNKSLVMDYRREIEIKNQIAEQERYESMQQAQKINQQIQEALEREKQAEREYKMKLIAWSQEEMRRNEELKELKKRQQDEERVREREFIERKVEANVRREQNHIASRNSPATSLFEPEMESMNSYKQRQVIKEREDKLLREKAQKDTKEALAYHLQMQDFKKQEERDRMQREREEMEAQIQQFKAQEEYEKELRKRQMQEYRSSLEVQRTVAIEGKLSDEQLNSREKMHIQNLTSGKTLQSPLSPSDVDTRKPLGVYNKPPSGMKPETPKQRSNSLYSHAHDPNQHNPILNPIGANKPSDGSRSRGRGLSKLAQAGTSIFG